MIVVTPAGTMTLGTVEAAPSIGIIDYSRRVTDDFGITTVVERGFARRMSVRLAIPSDQIDAVQAELARLRASVVTWIADDRFNSLSFQGFLKEFEIDLPGAQISYCTLTVESSVEPSAPAEGGGDPAPSGQSSSLRLIQPLAVTDAALQAASVPETDYPVWSEASVYPAGARVILSSTHRIYESVAAGNVGDDPAASSGKWIEVGPTNRWAMFDQALGTATTAANTIQVTIASGTSNALALLDVAGATVRVIAAGYDRTVPIGAGAITFLDLPGGAVTVTIAGDQVACGTLLIGRLVSLGITEAGAGAGITDYSRKVVDEFGEVTLVERAFAKRMTAKALIRTDAVDLVASRIAAVRARPSLWIGQAGVDSLTIYGLFRDFSIEIGETVSKLSLSIEGLSKAAPIADPNAPLNDLRGRLEEIRRDVDTIFSDGVVTAGREKGRLVQDYLVLVNGLAAIDARFSALGSPADVVEVRTIALNSRDALDAVLLSYQPTWNDVTTDTLIDRPALRAAWITAEQAIANYAAAITGRKGDPGEGAYTVLLTNELHQLPAEPDGTITSYAGAEGNLVVILDGTDVTGECAFSTVTNEQGVTRSGSGALIDASGFYRIDGGLDGFEPSATATLRARHRGFNLDKVFSLLKSTAAVDGVSPPLIRLAASQQMVKYNSADEIVSGDITFTATRINTDAPTQFEVEAFDGTNLAGPAPASAFAMYPGSFYSSGPDNVSLTQAYLDQAKTYGGLRVIATSGTVFDIVSLPRIKDGTPGQNAPLVRTQWSINGVDGWHDNFFGADVYQRQSNDGGVTWGPALRVIGEAGIVGPDGTSPSSIFRRSATVPATPGTSTGNPPPGWSDGPPEGDDFLWQSNAKFRGADQLTAWSTPVRISGKDGEPGVDGFVIEAIAPFVIPVYSSGAVKPSWTGGLGTIRLRKGGAHQTAGVTYAVENAVAMAGLSLSGADFSFAAITADSGSFDIVAIYAGVAYRARVEVKKVYDGSAAFRGSVTLNGTNNYGAAAQVGSGQTPIPGGSTVILTANINYSPPDSGGVTATFIGRVYLYYRNVTDDGPLTALGSQTGSQAYRINSGTAQEPEIEQQGGSVSASFSFPSASADKVYFYEARFERGSGANFNVTINGVMKIEVVG